LLHKNRYLDNFRKVEYWGGELAQCDPSLMGFFGLIIYCLLLSQVRHNQDFHGPGSDEVQVGSLDLWLVNPFDCAVGSFFFRDDGILWHVFCL